MKVHLSLASEPLKEKRTVVCLCGAEIPNARFPFIVEGDIRVAELSGLGNCRKCIKKLSESKGRYLYGVTKGDPE